MFFKKVSSWIKSATKNIFEPTALFVVFLFPFTLGYLIYVLVVWGNNTQWLIASYCATGVIGLSLMATIVGIKMHPSIRVKIYLKNGNVFEGCLINASESYIVFETESEEVLLNKDEIVQIRTRIL